MANIPKRRRFCFTWNNYTNENVNHIKSLGKDIYDYIVIGFEIAPTTQTKHLQGYIEFKNQLMGSQVKKLLDPVNGLRSKVHLIPAHGSRKENFLYCSKKDSKDPNMDPMFIELCNITKKQGTRSDWAKYVDFLHKDPNLDNFMDEYPEIGIKYYNTLNQICRNIKDKKMYENYGMQFQNSVPFEWQNDLIEQVKISCDPKDRKIIWYIDKHGNNGKTWISKFLQWRYQAVIFENAGSNNIAFTYTGQNIVVFDFARRAEDKINYQIIEQIKNGVVFSGKYESKTKYFPTPHVICMSNFVPDIHALSRDRWDIRMLTNQSCKKYTADEFKQAYDNIYDDCLDESDHHYMDQFTVQTVYDAIDDQFVFSPFRDI